MSLPIGVVACKAWWAVRHTLPPMDDKVIVPGQVHLGAHIHGDTLPALELEGVMRTVRHTAAFVVVVEAGGAGHVVVRFSAAAKALAVATLPSVCAGELAVIWANWRRQKKRAEISLGGVNV